MFAKRQKISGELGIVSNVSCLIVVSNYPLKNHKKNKNLQKKRYNENPPQSSVFFFNSINKKGWFGKVKFRVSFLFFFST